MSSLLYNYGQKDLRPMVKTAKVRQKICEDILMKTLFTTLLITMSQFSFATDFNASSAFLELFALGTHNGVDANAVSRPCSIQVSKMDDLPYDAIKIEVKSENNTISKIITTRSVYRYNPGNSSYLQSDKFYYGLDFNNYIEVTFRTKLMNDNKLYFVANHRFVKDSLPEEDTIIECIFR